jgi:hypothetical protein
MQNSGDVSINEEYQRVIKMHGLPALTTSGCYNRWVKAHLEQFTAADREEHARALRRAIECWLEEDQLVWRQQIRERTKATVV